MRLSRVGPAMVFLLAASACNSSGSSVEVKRSNAGESAPVDTASEETTAPGADPSGTLDIAELDSQLTDFLALPADQRETTIAALDAQVERELYVLSGLEDALGGPAAADEAFLAAATGLNEPILALRASPPDIRSWGPVRPAYRDDAPNLGEALFGALVSGSLLGNAAVSATNNGEPLSGSKDGITITGSRETVSIDFPAEYTSKGVTTKLRSKITDLVVCPDLNGQFTGKISMDMSATATGGSVGQTGTIEVKLIGQVDDNAEISGLDMDIRTQFAKFADGGGAFADVSLAFGTGGSDRPTSGKLNRSGGAATDQFVTDTARLGAFIGTVIAIQVADHAKEGWQSGRCVTLEPTASPGPKGLKPLSTSTITAAPRSKLGGGAVGGTVTATLSAGGAGVEPSATKVPADATFTYTAPDQPNQSGTVSLEARSKRGVAKADITFDTSSPYAYSITGGLEDFQVVDQAVCDVREPFDLVAPGVATASFSGGDSLSGTYSATGVFNLSYSGTYTITLPEGPGKPGTMIGTSDGSIADQAGGGSETYVLTPLESCG